MSMLSRVVIIMVICGTLMEASIEARRRPGNPWWMRVWAGKSPFEFGSDNVPASPWKIDFRWFGKEKKDWWTGPNVCERKSETFSNSTEEPNAEITFHRSLHMKICDESDSVYKCTTTTDIMGNKSSLVEIKECCYGYRRDPKDFGCPQRLRLQNLMKTLENMNLTEFVRAINSVGIGEELLRENFTLFAPVNAAFLANPNILPEIAPEPLQDMPLSNMVLVSKDLSRALVSDMKNLVLGHVVVGNAKTSALTDEQVLQTGSAVKSTIRMNFYAQPEKIVTANCARILRADKMTTNGIIHTVDRILEPVTRSITDHIASNPELTYLKKLINRAVMVQKLRGKGQYTFFAPTDAAFLRMDPSLRDRLFKGEGCLEKLVHHLLLPNVICSTIIQGRVRSHNVLGRYLNLTRDENNKLFVEGSQIVTTDIIATNGVMHVIDDVIVPDDALNVLDVAANNGASEFIRLTEKTGINKMLIRTDNLTLFAPSNSAMQAMDPEYKQILLRDSAQLNDLIMYHFAQPKLSSYQLRNGQEVESLQKDKHIRVNEFHMFPSFRNWVKTVQCSPITVRDLGACNGQVYIIDKVMQPPQGTVMDVLSLHSRFKILVRLFKKAGLADSLHNEGPFTVFAPDNQILEALGQERLERLENDKHRLKIFLNNHIVKGSLCCAGIFRNHWFHKDRIRMRSGVIFPLYRDREDQPKLQDAMITKCDMSASNGVVHEIDTLLTDPHRQPNQYPGPSEHRRRNNDRRVNYRRRSPWHTSIHKDLDMFDFDFDFGF